MSDSYNRELQSTFNDIVEALKNVDPVLLNRFFANGNNRMHVSLACPPECDSGNSKCFVDFNGIDCFSKGKKVGDDKKSGFELYQILKASPAMSNAFAEVTPEQLTAIKQCKNEQKVLDQLNGQLSKLVDGIGWGCSIHDYVQDRYSRYLVNKALEHGIDVSKNGSLVNELTSRLSGISTLHPTKSDLATFAKREGINTKSDAYKAFLDDIEHNAEQTSKDILLPIENALYFAVANAANGVLGYAALDQSPKAKKLAKQIASELFAICDSIEDCTFDSSKLDAMKKALEKVCAYKDIAPAELRIACNGIPYAVTCECDKLSKISGLVY